MRLQPTEPPLKLDGLASAEKFFAGCIADADRAVETLWIAHVDDQMRCIHLSRHDGEEGAAELPIRQVVADAALLGSAGIVLAHNHPSGNPRPSDSDCRATRRLAAAAEALDCTILDHLIFGDGECTSMRRIGLL